MIPKRGVIRKRINQGEYSLNPSHLQYMKHQEGTKKVQEYSDARLAKWVPAKRFAIHCSKKSSHIVPVEEKEYG